jgi:MraZ protein
MEQNATFRGNSPAKIDDKGRLKIPSIFRGVFAAHGSREVFITSEWGDYVRIYPLSAWIEIEKRIQRAPSSSEELDRFVRAVNYHGQMAELDSQDRVLIHPRLREKARTLGDVEVQGALTHLEVWDRGRFEQSMLDDPYTKADKRVVKDLGI